jgi:hypothetical protein
MSRNPIRDSIHGFSFDQDRLWIIHTPGFIGAITDYNDEITGFTQNLHELDLQIIHYGGNAYYVTGRYAQEKGWRVEECEDRK